MALYAIGDLHLSLSVNKPMDIFGDVWANHTEKILAGFSRVRSDDTVVLCGDTSWGISLEEALEDFRFIDRLPGQKLLLKGNHDYWWETAAKMHAFLSSMNCTPCIFCTTTAHFTAITPSAGPAGGSATRKRPTAPTTGRC